MEPAERSGGMFEPLKHKCVYEDIVDIFTERIRLGRLTIGQKLPPERALAEELGVSRTSLREALRVMESMGYIRAKVNGGKYISEVSLHHLLPPFNAMVVQDKDFAADVFEVRLHVEAHIAFLAAQKATKEQLYHMYAAILETFADIEGGGDGLLAGKKFHHEVARASHSRAFAVIAELCVQLIAESRRNLPGADRLALEAADEHLAIFEAIRDGDAERAAETMRAHINNKRSKTIDTSE